MSAERARYVRCRKGRECPVCEHDSWCSIGPNGQVMCRRVESAIPKVDKEGSPYWIHEVGAKPGDLVPSVQCGTPRKTENELRTIYATHRGAGCSGPVLAEARRLGVRETALHSLGVCSGSDRRGQYTLWPMYGPGYSMVGLMRRYADGTKRYWPGGSVGVFVDQVERISQLGTVHVVEGGSDCAALMSIGLTAIGRPSNTGGMKFLKWLRQGRRLAKFLVMAERDWRPGTTGVCRCEPDDYCANCWPGLYGAVMAARAVGGVIGWPKYPAKDVRDSIRLFGVPY